MLNRERYEQFITLMRERSWDLLLFYGDGWRKEHFRCLINLNYCGPHALTVLSRGGEITTIVTDPWDVEPVRSASRGKVILVRQLADGFREALAGSRAAVTAVNGLEQMEARFVTALGERLDAPPVSATMEVEEIRRVK